jgi:hypothetical protein
MLAEKLKPPNPLPVVLACTDSHHLGAPADNVRRDAVVFSTVTFEIVLTMSTQTTFACDACELNFQDEASLMEHRTQDYQVRTPLISWLQVSTSPLSRFRPSSNKPCNS